jgi:hypothetical protein
MALHLKARIVRPGTELGGWVSCSGAATLRLRGEATTFRRATDADEEPRGWLADSRVLLWEERQLGGGTAEFAFRIPAGVPPTLLGRQVRIAYALELYGRSGGPAESSELVVLGSRQAAGPALRVALVSLDAPLGRRRLQELPAELLEAEGVDEALAQGANGSWLERMLQGRNRMDRILERAVRGKLVEPEELLAMQASMYGYSRALAQIQPRDAQDAGGELLGGPSFVLPRDTFAAGERVELRLEAHDGPGTPVRVRLQQLESSSCHGSETLLESVVADVEAVADSGGEVRLELPEALPPSVHGPHLDLGYLLSLTAGTEGSALHGSVPLRLVRPDDLPLPDGEPDEEPPL